MAEKKTPPAKKTTAGKKKTSPRKTGTSKKPSPAKKKPAQGGKKAQKPKRRIGDRIITISTTCFFVAFAVFVAYVLLHPGKIDKPLKSASKPSEKVVPLKIARFEKPDFEIFPAEPIPSKRAAATPRARKQDIRKAPPVPLDQRPVLAIIIDDFGYDMEMAKKFLALDPNLTCAVLPQSVYFRRIAELARKSGHEVMLHQPMEPVEYPLVDPGPGALLTAMTPDERIRQLNDNIDSIPGVCGVNNHMGSKTTTMSDEMNQIFTVLKRRGLFFVDSRTTAATLSLSSARLFNVPFAERDVFLDHVRNAAEIRAQVDHLVAIAEVHGKALGIGHPYEVTYQVLKEALPDLKKRVRLIPASEIVEVF
jgi:polysaccharide deacetylase 2 family uncharacterized protein YibQ